MSRTTAVVLALLAAAPGLASPAGAQATRAAIHGRVALAEGTTAAGIVVTLYDPAGARIASTRTDGDGRYRLDDIAPGHYAVVAATAYQRTEPHAVAIASPAPVSLDLQLAFTGDGPSLVVGIAEAPLGTRTTLAAETLRTFAPRLQSRALAATLSTLPGWSEEDNGLLHVRGVDDGTLYVEDGIPIYDRTDVAFGLPPSLSGAGTVNVTTGHTRAEFGLKAGAVVEVFSPPAPDGWRGALDAGSGGSAIGTAQVAGGGRLTGTAWVGGSLALERSSRFLDPVHPDNLHNTGGVIGGDLRASLAPTEATRVRLTAIAGRSRFEVPHGDASEAAGQDQRQRIAQQAQTAAWEHVGAAGLATHVAGYHRRIDARLRDTPAALPLFASSTRRHDRLGLLGSVGTSTGRHDLKAGAELARLSLTEAFLFGITDADDAEATGLSPAAAAFTLADPFTFDDAVNRTQWSAYVQDRLRIGSRLTLDLGLRFDRTRLLVAASQLSPRLGVAYDVPGAATSVRASYNRFFQPPQPEHLLLSSSAEARALSPFAAGDNDGEDGDEDDGGAGGATLLPERQHAWELGVERWLGGRLRVDAAAWLRRVTNYTDPNVFFGTTIVFPNSVASGRARGFDLRLELPRAGAWSAAATYTLSQVEQTGPINGGLFLEDDIDEIGPGVTFTPDHDQRHTASAGLTWTPRDGRWTATASARYASGTPVELGDLGDDDIEDLAARPGASLIDLARGRVRPRLVLDLAAGLRVAQGAWGALSVRASLLNVTDRAYAFNFGNPFSGTHFGAPRQMRVDARLRFR